MSEGKPSATAAPSQQPQMSQQLEGKVSIITGAGQGIGRALAIGCSARGAKVVVNDLNAEAAAAVVKEITAAGGSAVPAVAAIGVGDGAETIVRTALEAFGRIDVLINNAGIHNDRELLDMDPTAIEESVDVNVTGTILLTREVTRELVRAGRGGKIISITSRAGLRGKGGETVYAAGKAALAGFTLALSIELAPHGVNVNAVAPAAWTPMLEAMEEPYRSQTIEKRKSNVLGRVAMPEDVVPTIAFLSSSESDYLTGQIIEATGQQASLL